MCTRACVCFWKGKERECIMTVKVYNHRYSIAEVPSQISGGISINSSNRQQQKHLLSSPVVTCIDFPREALFWYPEFHTCWNWRCVFLGVSRRSKWLQVSCIVVPAGRLYVWKSRWFQTHTLCSLLHTCQVELTS